MKYENSLVFEMFRKSTEFWLMEQRCCWIGSMSLINDIGNICLAKERCGLKHYVYYPVGLKRHSFIIYGYKPTGGELLVLRLWHLYSPGFKYGGKVQGQVRRAVTCVESDSPWWHNRVGGGWPGTGRWGSCLRTYCSRNCPVPYHWYSCWRSYMKSFLA